MIPKCLLFHICIMTPFLFLMISFAFLSIFLPPTHLFFLMILANPSSIIFFSETSFSFIAQKSYLCFVIFKISIFYFLVLIDFINIDLVPLHPYLMWHIIMGLLSAVSTTQGRQSTPECRDEMSVEVVGQILVGGHLLICSPSELFCQWRFFF